MSRRKAGGWESVQQLREHLAGIEDGARVVNPPRPSPKAGASPRPADGTQPGPRARRQAGLAPIAPRKRVEREHKEQVAVIDWARRIAALYPVLDDLYAIPNGGFRTKATAGKMKAEGVVAGWPDLGLAAPRFWPSGEISHGMYIEMKVAGGRVKPHQKAIHERLRARGYHVIVAWSAREAIEAIARYLDIEHGLDNNWGQ